MVDHTYIADPKPNSKLVTLEEWSNARIHNSTHDAFMWRKPGINQKLPLEKFRKLTDGF